MSREPEPALSGSPVGTGPGVSSRLRSDRRRRRKGVDAAAPVAPCATSSSPQDTLPLLPAAVGRHAMFDVLDEILKLSNTIIPAI